MKPPEIRPDADSPVPAVVPTNAQPVERKRYVRWAGCAAYLILLGLVFGNPLLSLIGYATKTPLFSYILWIPVCTAFLIYMQSNGLPKEHVSSPVWALAPFALGLAAWFAGSSSSLAGRSLSEVDHLALLAFSLVCFLVAAGFLFLGRKWMAAAAFPVAFLLFMIPLPDVALTWMETSLQKASAEAANLIFSTLGTPFMRDGLVFQLPGFAMQVAQECSGIQASWILFVSTVLASYLFLKSPWRRTILILAVIPLGIIRNGFRIVTIGLLCVHVGPHMVDSAIHRRGGPFFLGLSLIPLSIFLWWLRRGEVQGRISPAQPEIGGKG